MGLIKKKLEKKKDLNNVWTKNLGKKVAGVALASTITFGSLFGFAGCANKDKSVDTLKDNNPVTDTETQNQIEILQEMVERLDEMVSIIDASDDNLRSRINMLRTDLERVASITEDTREEVFSILGEIEEEIKSIKERLDELENATETQQPTQDFTNVENELAKMKARLAIENCLETYYTHISFDNNGDYGYYNTPNGDTIFYDKEDCMYYEKEMGLGFISEHGEEEILAARPDTLYPREMLTGYLLDEGFALNTESTSDNSYVFENAEGATLTVNVELGVMTSVRYSSVDNSESEFKVSRITKADYEEALMKSKSVLQSIGIFESFKKDLEESLDYKYKGVTATMVDSEGTHNGSGVFSGQNAATQTTYGNATAYLVQDKSHAYGLAVNKNGETVDSYEDHSHQYDLTQSFKQSIIFDICNANHSKISKDDETGTYNLISSHEYGETKIEIKFSEDLSVEMKVSDNDMSVTYKIEKITKAQFEETYNRINDILESVKSQQEEATISQ